MELHKKGTRERRKPMSEETAIRIDEGIERVARATEIVSVFGFLSLCVAIILLAFVLSR